MSGIVIAHENNGSALSLVSARIHYDARSHSVIHDVVKAVRGITSNGCVGGLDDGTGGVRVSIIPTRETFRQFPRVIPFSSTSARPLSSV